MALPTFNGFSLQDSNFITEKVIYRGYAERETIRAHVARREGVKLLNTEYGEKEITVEGVIIASSASDLQSLVDALKLNLQGEEKELVTETGRAWTATTTSLVIPDEHYNQSKAPFAATFICSDPFAEGSLESATTPVPSGIYTYSGMITISGTFFNRPIVTYTPGTPSSGDTLITKLTLYHIQSGQSIIFSGFGNGTRLGYGSAVIIDFDQLIGYEGSSAKNVTGAFPRWEPGINSFTLTSDAKPFPGGSVNVKHRPRYL